MNNFFGKIDAEWVDPAVELPPDGWKGLAINEDNDVVYATSHVPRVLLGHLVAWLRIGGPSDAIPREKVQALADMAQKRILQYEIVQASEIYGLLVQEIEHFTGVKPKEES